ncbi:MAG: thioredoxin domain-containing protein [Spirochaetes bacterium]|nr:thioredoxin domain-containing protein [Spirochaetota bacterium]MBN2770677.1 thioredoxin domain-containing protein [Spirochaetota bacterium]
MNKTYILLSIFSFVGLILAVILLADHYIPQKTAEFLACGDGLQGSCSELSSSPYSMFFGIPIASYGFFFYLWIFLSLHLFRESGERYWKTFMYLMIPISVAGIFFDIVLGALLVYLQVFCQYCVMTYVVNIAILAVVILAYRKMRASGDMSFKEALFGFAKVSGKNDDRKFSTGTFIYFTAILFIFVVAFSLYLEERSSEGSELNKKLTGYVEKYKEKEILEIDYPETGFVVGDKDAVLTVHVFTDPFCPACRNFNMIEKVLVKKYKGKINFKQYYYPLNSDCNPAKSGIVINGSCAVTRLFYAADNLNIYPKVFEKFYEKFDEVSELSSSGAHIDKVIEIVAESDEQKTALIEMFNSDKPSERITKHLDLAKKLNISATPTLIINGRLMKGYPKDKFMDAVLRYELSESIKNN